MSHKPTQQLGKALDRWAMGSFLECHRPLSTQKAARNSWASSKENQRGDHRACGLKSTRVKAWAVECGLLDQRLSQVQPYQPQTLRVRPWGLTSLLYLTGSQQEPDKTQETRHSSPNAKINSKSHRNLHHLWRESKGPERESQNFT